MKQLLQSLKDGSSEIVDVPVPRERSGYNLIATSTTLVSAGTERMLVEFGKSNLLKKASSQPEKVKMVLDKVRTDGLFTTIDAVKSKLDQPLALGYCNVGTIVSADETGFNVGQRVVSNGNHAEIVSVPKNLCAAIPDNVDDQTAAFTVIASIGLQGIRLANPSLGETVVVMGLGLIGLLTVQMLRAQGCHVIGTDFDRKRLDLAQSFGAKIVDLSKDCDPVKEVIALSGGIGADAVIITAATSSNQPIAQAAQMSRKRGRIILVGVIGLQLNRADFYEKELTFQVSCSYGPGRYDRYYEELGNDYPIGYVRWTEKRNFEAVLDMMSSGAIKTQELISHVFDLSEAQSAMELLASNKNSLGILIEFESRSTVCPAERTVSLLGNDEPLPGKSSGVVGFIGAGNYAGRQLMPAFKNAGAAFHTVVSSGGVSASYFGRKFGFRFAASDTRGMLDDPTIDAVVIATRHNAHAGQVCQALDAKKHVFCEKPLCLTLDELSQIEAKYRSNDKRVLMVGFNRRFSLHVKKMRRLLESVQEPKSIIVTVNAGEVPKDHWTQDILVGGGRIIGECCHFFDIARYLVDSPIVSFEVSKTRNGLNSDDPIDTAMFILNFEDGSTASINYLASGHKSFPKETIQVFAAGKVLHLDNFRHLRGWGWKGFKTLRTWRQDKGQVECVKAFMNSITTGDPAPIPATETFEVSRITIEVANKLKD